MDGRVTWSSTPSNIKAWFILQQNKEWLSSDQIIQMRHPWEKNDEGSGIEEKTELRRAGTQCRFICGSFAIEGKRASYVKQ